jgi:hypothetical protein
MACTFEDLEKNHGDDPAFPGFRVKLATFLNIFLPNHGIPLPEGKRIAILPNASVSKHLILSCTIY